MTTYTIEFNGREDGAIGSFSNLSIDVKTSHSLVGVDNAIMVIRSAGYECRYIIDIKILLKRVMPKKMNPDL